MTSVLSKAVRLSAPISARTLLQASRSGIILPRYVLQPASVRWSHAAAVAQKEEIRHVPEVSLSSSKDVDSIENDHAAIEEDQPAFSTLEGVISPDTLKALTVTPMKLTHMSPVQAAVLPMLPQLIEPPTASSKTPRDLLVKARTGTGKTVAFLVPAIEARIAELKRFEEQATADVGEGASRSIVRRARDALAKHQAGTLIISPTRELATQIAVEATKLCKHHRDLHVHLFVGGESKYNQLRHWNNYSRDIVIATPGRIRDMLENEEAVAGPISKANLFIMDEADTLLDMGFREDIEAIARKLPKAPARQTFMFSATVSRAIQQIARSTLDKNHEFINCVSDDAPPVHAHVPQYHTVVSSAADQIPHVLRLIAHDQLVNKGKSKILLFLPTTRMTGFFSTLLHDLRDALPENKTWLFEIHSKRSQGARTRASDEFRNMKGAPSVLVSSDVSARGVDYPGVTRVIQIGVPATAEQYVHRVGRTGRGTAASGRADLVLLPWEVAFVKKLNDIPLKPLTVQELTSQVSDLASEHQRGRMTDLDQQIYRTLERAGESFVTDVMLSNMGYYVSLSDDLRVDKPSIIEKVKEWAVEAGGLKEAPVIPHSFLPRLGVGFAKKERGLQSYRRGPSDSSPHWQDRRGGGNHWESRGREGRSSGRWEDRGEGSRSGGRREDRGGERRAGAPWFMKGRE